MITFSSQIINTEYWKIKGRVFDFGLSISCSWFGFYSDSGFFLLDIGLSQRTSSHFILNHGAGFYESTIPQHPGLQHMQQCQGKQTCYLLMFQFQESFN